MRESQLTIVVSGMIAGVPYQGGATWAVLQYLLGFQQLGHEVYYIEPVTQAVLQPKGVRFVQSVNAQYFHQVMADFRLSLKGALLLEGTEETVGLSYRQLCTVADRADVLINIAGILADERLIASIPTRVYLDLDPAFTQLWASQGINMRFAGHTHHVTIGQSLGQPGCTVPVCGLHWLKTLQPVVLTYWPVASRIVRNGATTVANWRAYGSIEHEGMFYGQKVHSLRPLMSLPTLTSEKFILALAIHSAEEKDLLALAQNHWHLLDPLEVAQTPHSYQHFIQGSKVEFGLAKAGYVTAQCGWFSDRSVCYLASGRPVIAQETGFSQYLPIGEGLFHFVGHDDVLAAIEAIRRDYTRHARAARAIAEECFDSQQILARLLDKLERATWPSPGL